MNPPDLLPRTACPTCGATTVDRLWVGSWRVDACRCRACGHGWDETGPERT